MSVSVQVLPGELANVRGWMADLDKDQAKANRRALLKAGKKAISLTVKELAALEGVKQKTLRRRIKAFPAPRSVLGRGDFIRLWAGLLVGIDSNDDAKVAKAFPKAFTATMKSGKTSLFARRPNAILTSPRSVHDNPSPDGNVNLDRHALPIDKVRKVLKRARVEPIIFRHARAVAASVYPPEFLRLLEVNAKRLARKRGG